MSKSIPLVTNTPNPPKQIQDSPNNSTKKTSHISLEISAEKTQKALKSNSNDESSIYIDENGKDIILLEESSKTKTFLRKCGFMFSIFFIIWSSTVIVIINSELDDPTVKKFLNFATGFAVLIFVGLKIMMAVFDRKLRKFSILVFSIDLLLLFLILFGLKEYLKNSSNLDIKKLGGFYEYIVFFGVVCFFNVSVFVMSTFLNASDRFGAFMSFVFMTVSTAVFVFTIPFIIPEDFPIQFDTELRDLVYFFFVITAFNIYFCADLYLIITRMCHKLTDQDYDIVYFFIWTDWAFRFWKNLFFRKKRIFDIEDKEEEEEDEGEVIEL